MRYRTKRGNDPVDDLQDGREQPGMCSEQQAKRDRNESSHCRTGTRGMPDPRHRERIARRREDLDTGWLGAAGGAVARPTPPCQDPPRAYDPPRRLAARRPCL